MFDKLTYVELSRIKRILFKRLVRPAARIYWLFFRPKTSGARAILLYGETILLIKNMNSKHWSLPGGKIDKNEKPEACVIREIKEELDVFIRKIDYKLGEFVSQREGKYDTIHIFVIHVATDIFKKQWEIDDAEWFPLRALPIDLGPATLKRIKEFLSGGRNITTNW